jgi:hypothetical protein
MYNFVFYVPESHLDQVKEAVFAAGAGHIGDYDYCAWQTLGTGQFRAKPGADPYIGEVGKLEKVAEYKVEMVCKKDKINDVVKALKQAHPYETPAFHYWALQQGPAE